MNKTHTDYEGISFEILFNSNNWSGHDLGDRKMLSPCFRVFNHEVVMFWLIKTCQSHVSEDWEKKWLSFGRLRHEVAMFWGTKNLPTMPHKGQ